MERRRQLSSREAQGGRDWLGWGFVLGSCGRNVGSVESGLLCGRLHQATDRYKKLLSA